jgi:hypothetical protein
MLALPPAAGAAGAASGTAFSGGLLAGIGAGLAAVFAAIAGFFASIYNAFLNMRFLGIGRILTVVTGLIGEALGFLRLGIANLGRALVVGLGAIAGALGIPIWAVVAIIAAVIAAIVVLVNRDFRDALLRGLRTVANGFAQLPRIIGNVFITVARVLASGASSPMPNGRPPTSRRCRRGRWQRVPTRN